MSDENEKPNGISQLNRAERRAAKAVENRVNIAVSADKTKGVVRVQFAQSISWLELDPLGCANMIQFLGDKLRELQN